MDKENKEVATTKPQHPMKAFFGQDLIKEKFTEMLGRKAPAFITSVLQIAMSNKLLANADPMSVFNAAATAATLDLPINSNLGFAYIIPYKTKGDNGQYVDVAQFQLGYKGFIQLAQRSGQFKTISSTPIYEGQLVEQNPLMGYMFDFTKKQSEVVIGYAAYFELLNGFQKTLYMTKAEIERHGTKYSKTFAKGYGLWKDDFDAMASKTVLKLLLSKFAPLSVDMQRAVISDQSVIKDYDTIDVEYVDNVKDNSISLEDIKLAYEMKSDFLSEEQKIHIDRIIKEEESLSYKKVMQLLNSI
jgi:recombination protein RecT